MSGELSKEEQGRRIAELRLNRGLTQEMLAEEIGVDVGSLARWERGSQRVRSRNLAAVASALDVELGELVASSVEVRGGSERDLRTVEMVAWLAEASGRSFADTYQAVASLADQLDAESSSARHARNHGRAAIQREDLTAAVADYYGLAGDQRLYSAAVAGRELTLTILTDKTWVGFNVDLNGDGEDANFIAVPPPVVATFTDVVFDAAVARLADAEVNDKVLLNNPMYRLLSVDVGPNTLRTTFTSAVFADYALRNGLMEAEVTEVLAAPTDRRLGGSTPTPVRDALLPTLNAATDFESYACTGGPVCLFAAARPADGNRSADYALLVQVRGKQVMDIPGKLSTVPKGWHQPVGEASSQVKLGITLLRELEEELLGREDLEQLSDESKRTADPLHWERHPDAMLPLLNDPDNFHVRCTGFGLNLLSDTYEVPCLVVIDDENWWGQWAHLIAGNWETTSIDCHSSMDTEGLTALIHDPRWSNEGLFSLLQGLRCLAEVDRAGRVAAPPIHLVGEAGWVADDDW